MFTAAAVMTQIEKGRMGLEDPVSKYLPDAPASWRTMTVPSSADPYFGRRQLRARFRLIGAIYSDDELVKVAYGLPLDFAPGARWNYSNTGYALLGILIKRRRRANPIWRFSTPRSSSRSA